MSMSQSTQESLVDSKMFMRALEDSMFLRVRDMARRLAVSRGTEAGTA